MSVLTPVLPNTHWYPLRLSRGPQINRLHLTASSYW
jgi:hypothetical protein